MMPADAQHALALALYSWPTLLGGATYPTYIGRCDWARSTRQIPIPCPYCGTSALIICWRGPGYSADCMEQRREALLSLIDKMATQGAAAGLRLLERYAMLSEIETIRWHQKLHTPDTPGDQGWKMVSCPDPDCRGGRMQHCNDANEDVSTPHLARRTRAAVYLRNLQAAVDTTPASPLTPAA